MLYDKWKKNLIKDFLFHSDIEVNVEGNDEDDIYKIMTDTILERIANLINGIVKGEVTGLFTKLLS